VAAPHGVRRIELLDEARGDRHPAKIVPANREHLEHHREVWRPLLGALGEPDAEWDWLAEFDEAEEATLSFYRETMQLRYFELSETRARELIAGETS
jgi:hypothetical protein